VACAQGSQKAQKQEAGADAKAEGAPEEAAWFQPKTNTSVYVTGLPDGATVEEVAEEFSRCGIIKEDDSKQPRIKLYKCDPGLQLLRVATPAPA
jgi:HIV Tat-specific factor 1